MYCSGDGNVCQRVCGGIGNCLETCENYFLHKNLKNANDMHLCKVRVISECYLSWLNSETPSIQGNHNPTQNISKISRINLTYSIRDSIAISRRADHRTTKGIKAKILAPFNGASEEVISKELVNQRRICDNNKLRQFIKRDDKKFKNNMGPWTQLNDLIINELKPHGYILYYQVADLSHPIDSSERYYQLTLSDEFWLKNGRDYGQICIGIDGKYDLNIDRAPVLSIVAENGVGHALPLAFGKYI
jgi:hypothetical protein